MTKEKYTHSVNDVLSKVMSDPQDASLEPTRAIYISSMNLLDKQAYKDYYSRVTRACDTNIDAFCNIKNYYLDGPAVIGSDSNREQQIRIRDARDANRKKPEESPESWIQGIASQARSVSILLETIDAEDQLKSKIEKQIYDFFKSHSILIENGKLSASEKKDVVDNFSYEIALLLKEQKNLVVNGREISTFDVKKIGKIINGVRDFGNFEESSHHTMTITPTIDKNGDNIVWFSAQMNPLSKTLKTEYDELSNKDWYHSLSDLEKKLVERYRSEILSGDHVMPTQLRYLPGLKNCYMDFYGTVKDNKIDRKLHIAPHSGTMAHGGGKYLPDNSKVGLDRITLEQIKHSKELITKVGVNQMHLQVLNSSGTLADKADRNLCYTMDNVYGTMRRDPGLTYSRSGINAGAESDPLENVDNISKKAVDLDKQGGQAIWVKCKSGKDRTFMVLFNNITSILGEKEPHNKRAIADSLLYSNHAETMASSAGGSRGAVGLKLRGTYLRLFWTDPLKVLGEKSLSHILGANTSEHWENKISDINTVHPKQNKKIKEKLSSYSIEDSGYINDSMTSDELSARYNKAQHGMNNEHAEYNGIQDNNYNIAQHNYSGQSKHNHIQQNRTTISGPEQSNASKNWVIASGVVMGLVAGGPVGAVVGGALAYSLTKNTNVGVGQVVAIGAVTILAGAFVGPAAMLIPLSAYGVAKYSAYSREKQNQSVSNASLHNKSIKSEMRNTNIAPCRTPRMASTVRKGRSQGRG